MRRTKLIVSTVLVGLALGACSAGGDDDTAADSEPESAQFNDDSGDAGPADEDTDEGAGDAPAEEAGDEPAAGEDDSGGADVATVDDTSIQSALNDRHVIYFIDLFIETESIERATQQAVALAQTSGGFVANESSFGNESATLTLRVPVAEHASIVTRLEDLGTVIERSRDAQDVTSEVVDVDSRINSQQRSIARIRELLDAATDIGDVVSIESELARREANLDSLLSRQAELGSLTTLATITVTFQQIGEGPNPADDDDPTFISGLEGGWNAFTSGVTYVGAGLGAVLPFLGAAIVIAAPFLLLRRRNNVVGAKLEE
jgi:hypothetical protein